MPRRISKKVMSMYLRTQCERELYLSLHKTDELSELGLPTPVKRPGIGVLSKVGDDLEKLRSDKLCELLKENIYHGKIGKKYGEIDLEKTLAKLSGKNGVLLQARFSVNIIQNEIVSDIGVETQLADWVPDLGEFVPDILVVSESKSEDVEVCPDSLLRDVPVDDCRKSIEIYDIKHTSEANPSYRAEIAMYAVMLSNWLKHSPYKNMYYVSANGYLWTRFKQDENFLCKAEECGDLDFNSIVEALKKDSEDAHLRFYLPSVRQFLEDAARVSQVGSSELKGWKKLAWHVCGSCSSCDWLGDKRHLGKEGKEAVDNFPTNYCMTEAQANGHLSMVPGITRGAKRILEENNIGDISTLSKTVDRQIYEKHTILKKESSSLPARSKAILNDEINTDLSCTNASLAGFLNVELYVSVNFDSSAGLLTGLSLTGVAGRIKKEEKPTWFRPTSFVVNNDDLQSEWIVLKAFLEKIGGCLESSMKLISKPKGQIHFWERRQLTELCNSIGRHLPRVLELANKNAKALAWLFSPDEMVPTPDSVVSSTIAIIDDIVRRMVFTPNPHAITLFGTSESYFREYPVTIRDPYYREYLSSAIPRERIYEIWSQADEIKRGSQHTPRNTVIKEFSEVLEKQTTALRSICDRIRLDYSSKLIANAPHIPTSFPKGTRGVSFDSKLWIWWDKLDYNVNQLESHIRLGLDARRLEATYEAIILKEGSKVSDDIFEFSVAASSREAKFKESDSVLTLGKLGEPGFPLRRVFDIISPSAPDYEDKNKKYSPLWSVLSASLISFDRENLRAKVRLTCFRDQNFISYLIKHSSVSLLDDVFLMETKSPSGFNWSKTSTQILKEIGNPKVAFPDENAAKAMGIKIPKPKKFDTETSAACVLWNAPSLENLQRISDEDAALIAGYASKVHPLNDSQENAILHAARQALTVIWGPPGTGKTRTIASYIYSIVRLACERGAPLKVLITGPTYKAVEEVMFRIAEFVSKDPKIGCRLYFGYSTQKPLNQPKTNNQSACNYKAFHFYGDSTFAECLEDLDNQDSVVIAGSTTRQACKFSKRDKNNINPVFDVVVVDESSQVTVSHALSALSGLKPEFRLVVVGDHLQMPPITALDPPSEAKYLVGSILSYLREKDFKGERVKQCVLTENYRSSSEIVFFGSRIGYPSNITSANPRTALRYISSVTKDDYPRHLPWTPEFNSLFAPEHPVISILHEDEVSSQGNSFEAKLVAGIVFILRHTLSCDLDGRASTSHRPTVADEFWGKCIGVVTPHRAQRALVLREFHRLFPDEATQYKDSVDTVERFQGGERHCIIVTFGVGDIDVISGEEAFIMQLERINVSVSRAMGKCIVVMPNTLARYIPEDKKTLETAHAIKAYIEELCNHRIKTDLVIDGTTRSAEIRYHRSGS